jgi:hypothetical protein
MFKCENKVCGSCLLSDLKSLMDLLPKELRSRVVATLWSALAAAPRRRTGTVKHTARAGGSLCGVASVQS